MGKKAGALNDTICKKLAQAKGIITVMQATQGLEEGYGFAMQAVCELIDQADDAAVKLAQLAGVEA